MAYNKKEILKDVLLAIKIHQLKHFDYIEAFVSPCTKTLYDLFPVESKELQTIKRELDNNKISSKTKMINKWEDSDDPTLQIAAFKLIATNEERKALSTNWNENNHSGELNTNTTIIVNSEDSKKRLEKGLKELENE